MNRRVIAALACVGTWCLALAISAGLQAQGSGVNTRALSLRLVDSDLMPVEGARLRLEFYRNNRAVVRDLTTSDAFGIAHISRSADTDAVIVVEASGYATARRLVAGIDSNAPIAMEREGIVVGQARSRQSLTPIRNAKVIIVNYGKRNAVMDSLTADEDGRFRKGGLLPGRLTITALADGFAPVTRHFTISEGERIGLGSLLLATAGVIEGTIVGRDRATAAGVVIEVDTPSGMPTQGRPRARVDRDGRFTIRNVPPGQAITLRAELHGTYVSVTLMELQPGERRAVEWDVRATTGAQR